jgi:hypothetical protein
LLIMKMVIQINWHYTVPVLSYYRQRTWYCWGYDTGTNLVLCFLVRLSE